MKGQTQFRKEVSLFDSDNCLALTLYTLAVYCVAP